MWGNSNLIAERSIVELHFTISSYCYQILNQFNFHLHNWFSVKYFKCQEPAFLSDVAAFLLYQEYKKI